MVLTVILSVDESLVCNNTAVVLFIMMFKVVLTLKSVDKSLVCDHSNESYRAALSRSTIYYVVQSGSNFKVCG